MTSHRSNEPVTKVLVSAIVERKLGLVLIHELLWLKALGVGVEAILVCTTLNLKHSKFSKQKLELTNGRLRHLN
jgi:hypothetical protein